MTEETEEYYTENAEEWAEKYGEIHEAVVPLLKEFLELVGNGKVLDAGCGNGKHTEFFARHGNIRAVGIDSAPGMLEEAVDNEDREAGYSRMDVQDLGFYENTFDGVWCNTVMQFIPHSEKPGVLSEISRVLKNEGVFYTTFKLIEDDEERIYVRDSDGLKRYLVTEQEAESLLEKAGFKILNSQVNNNLEGPPVINVFAEKK